MKNTALAIGLLGFLFFFCVCVQLNLSTYQVDDSTADTKNFYGSRNASQYGSSDDFWNGDDDEILGANQEVNEEDFDFGFNLDEATVQDKHANNTNTATIAQGQEPINESNTTCVW